MLKIQMSMQGAIDVDSFEVECDCPRCGFSNPLWVQQARLRDVIICRGCKANIQLDDGMNTVRRAYKNINRAMREFSDSIAQFNRRMR